MSAGEIAGLIAAAAFVVLVGLLALPIIRLTRTFEEAQRSIERLTDEAIPTLRGTATTVDGVNATLVQAEGIASNVADMSTNASSLTSLLTATVGGPVVKVSAFSYGVRRAMAHRRAGGLGPAAAGEAGLGPAAGRSGLPPSEDGGPETVARGARHARHRKGAGRLRPAAPRGGVR